MNSIILRVDDVNATTTPGELEQVYGRWWAAGWPVCFSVIPRSAYRFGVDGEVRIQPVALASNPDLCAFLHEKVLAGQVEIALHGCEHHYGELAAGRARQSAEEGLAMLQAALPGIRVGVFVPPHDDLTGYGLEAVQSLGLAVCSTWAATHGGGHFAHWHGRLRRWVGRPFSRPQHRRLSRHLSTDSQILDFAREVPWALTERVLYRAWRTGGVPVFAQHYWLIQGERFRRWQKWISDLAHIPDFQVRTYADILDHRSDA